MGTLPKLIGVIHLPPLPGSPGTSTMHPSRALAEAAAIAVKEADIMAEAGFDGIILENFGDVPFYKTSVPPETIASMAVISAAIREAAPTVQIGINVLRNDARAALAIAAVTGADFIRVNILSGVAATDQGIIEGTAAELVRERVRLNAENVLILADVHVKHAKTLSSDSIALAIEEVAGRGGADGVIVSGTTTGRSPQAIALKEAVLAANEMEIPLYIGSGATIDTLADLAKAGIRIIVGSALRKSSLAGESLDVKQTQAFAAAWKKTQSKGQKKKPSITSVQKGLKQSAAGKTKSLGSFAKYLDNEEE
jgi:membrane complex biogenesis BtpA family protein